MRKLTLREEQVAGLTAQGFSIRKTASLLRIAEQTVKNHRNHVFRKLRVKNRLQMMLAIIRLGLLRSPQSLKTQSPITTHHHH
jgi:DNA-binding CsgD family transcriptional regulator